MRAQPGHTACRMHADLPRICARSRVRSRHKKCTYAQAHKQQKARKEQKEQIRAQESTTGDRERWKECAEQRAHHWNVRKDKARTARGGDA